jgi:hypothetical protein
MKYFVLRLFAPRLTFISDMTDAERTLMQAHVTYWSGLMAKGMVVIFGPVMDQQYPYGLGVVRLADGATPDEICQNDPVILAHAGFRYEVAPMARASVPA